MAIQRFCNNELLAEFWVCGKTITSGDYIKTTQQMIENEHQFQKLRFVFIDQSNAVSVNIDTERMPTLVELDKTAARINPDLCLAIISKKDILFGLSRMWQAMVGAISWQTYVSRDYAEAAEWLVSKIETLKDPEPILKAAAQANPQR